MPSSSPRRAGAELETDLCSSTGELLPAPTGQRWKPRFGLDIVNGVGSTEIGCIFLNFWTGHEEL
jgi:benzoate-CoA ligase